MAAFQYRIRRGPGLISIDDYRNRARRALPDFAWTYIDGGAEDLITVRANRRAFDRWAFLPRALTGRSPEDLSRSVAGAHVSLPVLLAPTGLTGLTHWSGEVGAAVAAERAGVRAILSTAASYSPEEVSAATVQSHFFQLYPWAHPGMDGRELTQSFLTRAETAGFLTLFVTVDVPVKGSREGELRMGLGVPPSLNVGQLLRGAGHPRWAAGLIWHRRVSARLLVENRGPRAAVESAERQFGLMRPNLNWDDFSWIRERWHGPVFVKGVLHPDDAERAIDLGANGVVVSNHGGRQLDGAISSLEALPAIAARIRARGQVLMDGGIRRGSDIVKALCLGADAVCVGRPYLYGLACRGQAGVEDVLAILRDEMVRTMTLLGVSELHELDSSLLVPSRT